MREIARGLWIEDGRPNDGDLARRDYEEWTHDILQALAVRGYRLVRPAIKIIPGEP